MFKIFLDVVNMVSHGVLEHRVGCCDYGAIIFISHCNSPLD